MIFGLTGTHGTGKTTLLRQLKLRGINVVEAQLSRAAQARLGWDKLSYAQDSLENMWALQTAIFHALLARDEEIASRHPGELVVVDRTPADVWAYTAMWLTRHGLSPASAPEAVIYRKTLESCAHTFYRAFIFLPPRAEIPFVAEPNRADIESRDFINASLLEFFHRNGLRVHEVGALSPPARAKEAIDFINGELATASTFLDTV